MPFIPINELPAYTYTHSFNVILAVQSIISRMEELDTALAAIVLAIVKNISLESSMAVSKIDCYIKGII